MKRILSTLLFLAAIVAGYSQMQNNGGTITIENGATLVIQGNYTSTNAGSIEIDGSVQLKGDFVNNGGNIHSGSTGTLTFNGTAAQAISGSVPTDFYCAVVVDNDGTGVSLTGADAVLYNALTLTDGKFTLNAYDLTMAAAGITANATNYVVTNDVGELKANVAAADVTYPVGDGTTYNPVVLNNTGGTADVYGVVFSGTMPGGWTGSDHAVVGHWTVSEFVDGGSNLSVTPYWAGSQEDPNFDNTDCAVGVSADNGATVAWSDFGTAAGTDPYNRTGTPFTSVGKFLVGDSFWGSILLNLDLILAGAYDVNTGLMSTALNALIPNPDPYGNGATHSGLPGTAVDWIELELRSQGDPTNIVYSGSFILNNDGNVLNVDGTSGAKIPGVAKANYYVALNHRNHLSVVSANPVDLTVASPAYDFRTSQAKAWQDGAVSTNAAMKEVTTGVFGLWEGDANDNGVIDYLGAGTDRSEITALLGLTTLGIPVNGYYDTDLNLDGTVNWLGAGTDRTVISAVLGLTTLGISKSEHMP